MIHSPWVLKTLILLRSLVKESFFLNAVICVFVTSRVLKKAIWSRGDTRRPARAHKVEAKFIASLTDLELVQDVFKAYNVNFV